MDNDGDMPRNTNDGLSLTVEAVLDAAGARSVEDQCYIERIRRYLGLFVSAMLERGDFRDVVAAWDLDLFLLSAHLHNAGNTSVADYILHEPEELPDEEFEDIINHVESGLQAIRLLTGAPEGGQMLRHAEMLIGNHHEKWDGSGYPRGLKGKRIPLQGRIMAIVDVYDALTTGRPQRRAKTHEEAVEAIRGGSGKQFDPELVEIFLACENEFK